MKSPRDPRVIQFVEWFKENIEGPAPFEPIPDDGPYGYEAIERKLEELFVPGTKEKS